MIYVGLISFNNSCHQDYKLQSALELYTHAISTVITKDALTLCYGKLANNKNDMDQVWENANSVLMGRVFVKNSNESFTENDFKNAASFDAQNLFEKIWGKYIYISGNKAQSYYEISIDTTGALNFYYHILPNKDILFASDIEIIFKVLNQTPEYNWEYICSYLLYGSSCSTATPFADIYELSPGCCLKITQNKTITEPIFYPLAPYNNAGAYKDRDVVDIMQDTLKSLIEPYDNICVSLSGGLDSSALVYCLNSITKKDQILSAQHYFHSNIKSSNELFYARKVCDETGIQLTEVDISYPLPFSPNSKIPVLNPNKPSSALITSELSERISSYLPSDGSCIFLSGHGSDHIFQRPPSKKSVSDYFLERGLKGLKEKIDEVSHFYRDPFLSILKNNSVSLFNYFLYKRSKKRHAGDLEDKKLTPKWFKEKLLKTVVFDFKHPIYENLPARVLPGKYEQIDAFYEGIASMNSEINPLNPTCHPFLCEPIVNFALSIPSYELFNKRFDRYPLRNSISNRFNTETVWRRDKGQTTGVFQIGIKQNLNYVLNICLEGELVKQGFIDKDELYKTILLISSGGMNDMWPFTNLASVEMFMNYWKNSSLSKTLSK